MSNMLGCVPFFLCVIFTDYIKSLSLVLIVSKRGGRYSYI